MSNKSVLDGVPVNDKSFTDRFPQNAPALPKVSSCPACGAPIYGKPAIHTVQDAQCVFSCDCRNKHLSFSELKIDK